MEQQPTAIMGAYILHSKAFTDTRGSFDTLFDASFFQAAGMMSIPALCSLSDNVAAGTLRGLHFQQAPMAEAKLVRCLRGRVFDVGVDLRPDSPSFRQTVTVELCADDPQALYLPAGCAHGFQSLVPNSQLLYLISAPYEPQLSRGIRHDDPELAIPWPLAV
ncbi:MAG: dTDP-4-keto-6-deoxy-D-glucose epimerase, partial [Alphaproteobacteria bacterium]|nr:dTDP-4-keto-6-deoxy-D-glucose epimerase [Alphaproteobacteria bacterium]